MCMSTNKTNVESVKKLTFKHSDFLLSPICSLHFSQDLWAIRWSEMLMMVIFLQYPTFRYLKQQHFLKSFLQIEWLGMYFCTFNIMYHQINLQRYVDVDVFLFLTWYVNGINLWTFYNSLTMVGKFYSSLLEIKCQATWYFTNSICWHFHM